MDYREVFMEVAAPAGLDGTHKLVGAGFMTGDPDGPAPRFPAPLLGQHTDEVLSEIGYSTDDIDALRKSGAI